MLSAKEVLRRGLENEPELSEECLAELAAEAAAQELVEEFGVEPLRRALNLAAANNHLARHPAASGANWRNCPAASCQDASRALGFW